jgi:transcriptional regulator with XRE-family HTH domain
MRLEWITSQLELHRMTQRELSERIGITEVQLSKTLKGDRRLTADEADGIRRVFGFCLPDDPDQTEISRAAAILSKLTPKQRAAVISYLETLAEID